MLVVVCSVTGAPGVSSTALLLGAVWPRPAVVVEADPSGGVFAARLGLSADEPNLASLAAAARHGLDAATLWAHAQRVGASTALVCAPLAGPRVAGALALAAGPLAELAVSAEVDVVIDAGRWYPGSPAAPLIDAGTVSVVVCRPRPDEVFAVQAAVVAGLGLSGLVVVGDRPHRPAEVAEAAGVPLAGSLFDDSRAARLVATGGVSTRGLQRSMLWRTGTGLATALAAAGDRVLGRGISTEPDPSGGPEGPARAAVPGLAPGATG
ncbi:MAG: hypothetical protein HYX34_05355 [Actinobacteria bacterium]|nr:hypothetical protein [Actinomycetota bacterium]